MSFGEFGLQSRSYAFMKCGAGQIAGSTSAKQGPNIPCEAVRLAPHPDNSGNAYAGGSNISTIEGYPITSDTGWIPITNLNLLYFIMDNDTDHVQYMYVGP